MPPTATPVVLITGASSGIGAATARAFAAEGYRLALVSRRREAMEQLCQECESSGPHLVFAHDLQDVDSIAAAASEWMDQLGRVDVLINNAGAGQYQAFLDTSREEHDSLLRLNYHAAAEMMRAVLPHMLRVDRGHIINVASMSTKMGPWGHATYSAAKAALVSLTQTLAAEHRESPVHFSVVNPGIIRTDYFQKPGLEAFWKRIERRAIEPEVVARAMLRLIARPRLEICVPRHYRMFDFIRAVSPDWAHRVVWNQSRPRA